MITNSEIECFLREVQGFIEQNKYIIKSTDKNDLLLEDFKLVDKEKVRKISKDAEKQDDAIRKYII